MSYNKTLSIPSTWQNSMLQLGKQIYLGPKFMCQNLKKRHQALPPRRANISVVGADVIGDTLAGRRRLHVFLPLMTLPRL